MNKEKSKLYNYLNRDVKEFNKIILSLVCITILTIAALISYYFTNKSYAYFTDNLNGTKTINLKIKLPPKSFSTDSWDTILEALQDGDTSAYNVGDTKEIDMGTYGTHTLRIANKSTPSECNEAGFSQTACGFVLEFADIITTHNMNSTLTNIGGWPASSMREFVNADIYNALPSELKSAIIDTSIVSGHGPTSGETNFTSTDKLYLLSSHEVWEDVDGDTSIGIDHYDTSYNNTRQLDYYAGLGVTTSNDSGAIKKNGSTATSWFLRSADSDYDYTFLSVDTRGGWNSYSARTSTGVSPAFRLGVVSKDFSTDSWDTIEKAVKTGNTSAYNVGDTKEIDMGTYGTHTLRIANKSTPAACNTTGFSQSACGFVLEFADIITRHVMNSADTNVGGWPASEMREFVNADIYNALPSELKSAIIDTSIVSGYGLKSGETNFTSTDKLYLLSSHEVWEDDDGDLPSDDTAYNNTRQLDYYAGLGVTISNDSGAIKKNGSTESTWWLRSTCFNYSGLFVSVHVYGSRGNDTASKNYGVSPAFRLS